MPSAAAGGPPGARGTRPGPLTTNATEAHGQRYCRLDEMAGSDRDELTELPSLKRVTRSLPQAKGASHGPCCDGSGREEIANLRAGRRRADSRGETRPTGDL